MHSCFLWCIAKGNHDSLEGGEASLEAARSAHKATTSCFKSNSSCPCANWIVSTIFNIDLVEAVDVGGAGSTAAVGSTYSSAGGSPDGGPLDASPVEDLTLGRLELAFNWVALCLRKVAPMGDMIWTGLEAGKSSKPKSWRILWIKIG